MFPRVRGNARGCLIFEPLWIIPNSLFTTYASVYMLQLGVSETLIGWLTTLNLVMQIIGSAMSGYLTDRLGRKRALLIFDVISWSFATLIWAVSQNVWYFLVAAILNSFQKIPNTAWYCVLVEDTEPDKRTDIFTVLQFVGVIGGLFAPLGGLLVAHFTLIPAVRIMYVIAFLSMTAMFILRNRALHETEMGLRKMQESVELHPGAVIREYWSVTKMLLHSAPLMVIFIVYILNNVQMTVRTTFLSIYLVKALHISAALIALFPAISSAAMLILMYFVVPKFRSDKADLYMLWGFGLSIASNVILVLIAPGSIMWVIVSTMLAAAGGILIGPFLESTLANALDDEHRAKLLSILTVLILVFTSPSGVIGGWTYQLNPKLPFLLVAVVFVVSTTLWLGLRFLGGSQVNNDGPSIRIEQP